MTKQSEVPGKSKIAGKSESARESEKAGETHDPRGDTYARWFLIIMALGFVAYGTMKYHQVTTALEAWEKQNPTGDDARFLPPNR